ncbi:MAG: hypothetical protein IJ915_04330 [Paludibacteraceae bacterium]|nr:hypothetical protein [Paludibacteraceae bacterium]
MTQHIEKQKVADRLDAAIGYPAGMEGLNTLLYGWTRKDENLRVNIRHRTWLYDHEVRALSTYAGYNLMPEEYDSVCEAE